MTSSEDVLLREVDEDLNQDRQLAALRRYGPAIAIAAIAFVVAIGVIQMLGARREAARVEAAEAYTRAVDEGAGAEALLDFASVAQGGYEALARLRAASLLAEEGDRERALRAYAEVYGRDDLPPGLTDLARLRAAYLAVEGGDATAAEIASGVETEAFLPFAQEVSALSAMARGDYASAEASFDALAAGETAPPGLRNRAGLLAALADAGSQGVPLEASGSATEDFIESFGRQLQDAGVGQSASEAPATREGVPAGDLPSDVPVRETEPADAE